MGRQILRLTAAAVTYATKPGLYADGDGLYLRVSDFGTQSWIFRYRLNGRKTPRDMGLGSARKVSLKEARQRAREAQALIQRGIDPLDDRRAATAKQAIDAARTITFKEAAGLYMKAKRPGWKSASHASQWKTTLETYAYPIVGDLPVSAIQTAHVVRVIEPIWLTITETAKRLQGRIELILDWAKANQYCSGENPARWKGQLENLLPSPTKVRSVRHHPALPYKELPDFILDLQKQDGIGALALEFLILTAARTGEVIGARWSEIDLEDCVWSIPAERMKAGRAHRVHLTGRTLTLLQQAHEIRTSDYVFPGQRKGTSISNMTMTAVLRRMKRNDITAHGFRSTFRDWAAEIAEVSNEVAEMALAHTIRNKVEAAYRRGDLFERRKKLMEDYARFCGGMTPL